VEFLESAVGRVHHQIVFETISELLPREELQPGVALHASRTRETIGGEVRDRYFNK